MEVKEAKIPKVKRKITFDDEPEVVLAEKPASAEREMNYAASRLLCLLAESHKNSSFVFCPISVFTVLAMLLEGAKEETADELLDFLGPDATKLIPAYLKEQKKVAFANAMFLNSAFKFDGAFVNSVLGKYYAALSRVDIATAAERKETVDRVNSWASLQTNGKIKNLVIPSAISNRTVFVLANAVHFSGKWSEAFDPGASIQCPFYGPAGTSTVTLMCADLEDVRYAAFTESHEPFQTPTYGFDKEKYPSNGFQVLELPFTEGNLSMVIVLPLKNCDEDHAAAEQFFRQGDMYDSFREAAEKRKVEVAIPRFSIECTENGLVAHLAALGVKKMSEFGQARLDGITGEPGEVYVSHIFHKAAIDVKEEGVEAAAATALIARSLCLPKFKPVFSATRTFMFAICDQKSGLVLFMGRFTNN